MYGALGLRIIGRYVKRQRSIQNTTLEYIWYKLLSHVRYWRNYSQCCYLPAVGIYPHNICERNQNTHCRHGMSQIVPVYVHIDEYAYKCTKSTYSHCYHVHTVNSRYIFHLNWNSCYFEEENHRTETTLRQSL